MTRIILALLLASAAPSHANECSRIDRLQMGLLVQGFTTLYVDDSGIVSRVASVLRQAGFVFDFDGFVIMPIPDGARLTLSGSRCAIATVQVDARTAEIVHGIIAGDPEGRDA